MSPQGALQVVNEFAAAGIVTVTPTGRALIVSLNRDHLTVEPILGLVGFTGPVGGTPDERELVVWPNLAGGWLFGRGLDVIHS